MKSLAHPHGKYSAAETKQEKPEWKVLNTGKSLGWKNRVFCFIILTFGKI